jgi:hypothetical protein
MPSLLNRSGEAPSRAAAAVTVQRASQTGFRTLKERFAKGSVEWSPDLQRVLELPRRKKPEGLEMQAIVDGMTAALKKPGGTQTLRDVQAWALWEMPQMGGGLGLLATGAGKTLLGMLMPMVWPWVEQPDGSRRPPRCLLLIPPDLREQFAADWQAYGQHWNLPNLAGGQWFDKNKPTLHVVAYSEFSHEKSSALLDQINPDLVMGDECGSLKNFEASRTLRMRRFFAEHPGAHFCGWDATLMSESVEDFWHLFLWGLDVRAPVPLEESEMKKWAQAIDPKGYGDGYFLPGELLKLCEPGESVRGGFQRRMVGTKGIVFTEDNELGIPLYFTKRSPPPLPEHVQHYLVQLRRRPENGGWKRPDGEELRDMTEVTAVAKQLALGCFMFWRFPRGETAEVIDFWFKCRQVWNREVRSQVSKGQLHMDSPKLCELAAERWFDGGCPACPRGPEEYHALDCPSKESHPLWDSYSFRQWREVEHTVEYVTETEWVSDWLLEDCAAWAAEKPGIVWVEHPEFGDRLSKMTKLPFFDGGKENNRAIIREDGSRSIICSVKANTRGKNLQAFSRNLITTFPSSNKTVEQVVGRTYREGQKDVSVTVYYYLHTAELENSLDTAMELAKSVAETMGQSQKLLYADWEKAA